MLPRSRRRFSPRRSSSTSLTQCRHALHDQRPCLQRCQCQRQVDTGETGTPNWKVYIDKNNNGAFDSGEKFRLTDANGDYSFDALTAARITSRKSFPTGFRRTFPPAANTPAC
jgi:hypothetical protein